MTEIALETDKTAVAKQLLPSPKLQHRNHLFLCHVCLQQNSTVPSISQTFVGFHDAFDFQASVCFELQKLPRSTATIHNAQCHSPKQVAQPQHCSKGNVAEGHWKLVTRGNTLSENT